MLTASAERHREQFDQLVAQVAAYNPDVDRDLLERAYRFASEAHEHQQRRSGEDFILHPLGVALILAELRSDDATIAAGILHDVVEDTDATMEQVRDEFGEDVARLVEGVTKLTRIHFQSREQAQAENYRKMIVAMAEDHRVILIKLADRLHNMRTIEYLGKQKQLQKARETLEVYAPLAHRLGIHTIKWELEDLAFQTLHPRKYAEIQAMVNERRAEREKYVDGAGRVLKRELDKVGIPAEISSRAKHFYSIYEKMVKRGKEFNEIYDLTAMRVLVEREGKEGERDCYGALGVIHSLWKPMPGRFKDYVAMPKFNMYRSLHTTVIGPEGKPLEIQVRTTRHAPHGRARASPRTGSTRARKGKKSSRGRARVDEAARRLAARGDRLARARARLPGAGPRRGLRLHAEGRGEEPPRRLDADRLRLLGAHRRRPPHRRRQGERPHRPAPLPSAERRLRRDPDLEADEPRPVARLALAGRLLARAQQDPAVVQPRDARGRRAARARGARERAQAAQPAVQEALGLAAPAPRSSARWASRRPRTSTSRSAPGSSRSRRSRTRSCTG